MGKFGVLLESPWWVEFNESDLDIFRPEVWHIGFWVVFFIENSIILQKMVIGGKIIG